MPDLGGSSEGNFIDIHVARERTACSRAIARQDVYNPFGKSSFNDEFANTQRGERGLLGRLHYDGVARRESGCQLPALHQDGEIPGNDLAHNSDWLMPRV